MRYVWLAVLTGFALQGEVAAMRGTEQKYSGWNYSSAKEYYYCHYFYKSNAGDVVDKEQYVIFNPKDPHWVYWCNAADNPDNKAGKAKFLGRCAA